MTVDGWNTVLVLGGIRSGKSELAESLVADAPSVRYVATSVGGQDDPEWLARIDRHQQRRPQAWSTEESGADPARLAAVIAEAKPDETLLVDDLGGWVTVLLDPAQQPADDQATITQLAAAVRDCAARLVLVSPEVGLSLVPVTPVGRAFADALGTANRALADACDEVVLVVAGQSTWLKPATRPGPARNRPADAAPPALAGTAATATGVPAPPETAAAIPVAPPADRGTPTDLTAAPETPDRPTTPAPAGPAAADAGSAPLPEVLRPEPAPVVGDALTGPTLTLPVVGPTPEIEPGMTLPMPDDEAAVDAHDRLATLDLPGAGLGILTKVVEFAAATQGTAVPQPWRTVRVLLLHGDHEGGSAAGDDPADAARRAADARAGAGPLGRLAASAAATLQVVPAPTAGAIEEVAALDHDRVQAALRLGWRLAEQAADDGSDALVLAACGAGGAAASAAVLAALAGAEPAAVLARVVAPGGRYDDAAWIRRCATVRDALHRTRHNPRDARDVLIELAGGEIAVATGVLLGAASRQLPVLLDGPVGVAAAVVTRELAGQARHWCLLPDHGQQPGVKLAAEVLGLDPFLNLRLDVGEGATALAALPLMRTAVELAGGLSGHPGLADADAAAAQHAAGATGVGDDGGRPPVDDPDGTAGPHPR